MRSIAAGWALPASLVVYGLAVASPWTASVARADRLGCVEPHVVQYQTIVVAGLLAGLALGPPLVGWTRAAARALLPAAPDARRAAFVTAAAWSVILVGMVASLVGVDPAIDRFLDTHRVLIVEADLVLYLMGLTSGAGWRALLGPAGWMGLLLSPSMALMLIGAGVVGRGWC